MKIGCWEVPKPTDPSLLWPAEWKAPAPLRSVKERQTVCYNILANSKILPCKKDLWCLAWSNAQERRYLRRDFCTGFVPTKDGTQRTGVGCTLTLIAAEQRGSWLFIFKPGFKFVLVMFLSTSKISRFVDWLCNSRFSIGFELVLTILTNQRE